MSFFQSTYRYLHQPALVIAGCFVLLASALSIFLIFQHLRSYNNPAEQKWIVAVVFMVPVYATESLYDSFQMILKTVCAILALVLEPFGVYGNGEFKWYYGYPYLAMVLNFSQMWALYCLVQFYNVTIHNLQAIKPLAKFIGFKAIVFATWWHGVGIALLCSFGVLLKEGKFQTALQDFFICIEMAIAAVAPIFVFPAKPYHFIPASDYGKVSSRKTETVVDVEDGNEVKPGLLEKTETKMEAPGTSIRESVQDIVVEGGQKVVKDVVLTINQGIEPVEQGVTKIQERFHQISVSSDDNKEEPEVKVEEHEKNVMRSG